MVPSTVGTMSLFALREAIHEEIISAIKENMKVLLHKLEPLFFYLIQFSMG